MTINDVARLAGVSSAAVSRYFNNGSLSSEKREKIRQAIEQTGYQPSIAGQMLRTGRVNQIGVIVPQMDSQSVSRVVEGIAERLKDSPYIFILGACGLDDDTELEYLQSMQKSHVAGIILMGTTYSPRHAAAFRKCKVPLVVTGQKFPGINCVYNDDFGAARDLAGRMINRGYRHFSYIGVTEKDLAVGIERRKGVQAAMEEAGLDPDELARATVSFTPENIRSAVLNVIRQNPAMDAMICATDRIALMSMQVLKSLGRAIPRDTGLAGFDSNWASAISEPTLSTVDFHQKLCGVQAADMILNLIESKGTSPLLQTRLGYTIAERDSF